MIITGIPNYITKKSLTKNIMKKVLVLVSAVLMLAGLSTSCNKVGCHCYLKADDETSTKEECQAKEAELNAEWGSNVVKCHQ